LCGILPGLVATSHSSLRVLARAHQTTAASSVQLWLGRDRLIDRVVGTFTISLTSLIRLGSYTVGADGVEPRSVDDRSAADFQRPPMMHQALRFTVTLADLSVLRPMLPERRVPRPAAHRAVAAATLAGFLLTQVPVALLTVAPAAAQTGAVLSRGDYEACQARDETAFKGAIEKLTFKGLTTGLATVDYPTVVSEEWRKSNMSDVIDRHVDQAIAEVGEENSLWSKASSIFSSEKSKELATTVSERVFKSEGMKKSLEVLATGVGTTLGKRIELASSDTAEPAMQCMQAFLGPRYGATIARVVSKDAGREFQVDPSKAQAGVSAGAVISDNAGGIAGAIILIVRRQLANMAGRVGARVVGSVLSRLVGVVAGGIGAVLILKDVWDFRNGVLPIIATEMKSKETKDKVQVELAAAMKEQIGENLKEIAAKTAERVVDVWQEFRRAHAKVLELADKNAGFKTFLDTLKPEALPRLDEVVALLLGTEGEAGILKRLDDGSLNSVVNVMTADAFEIARESKSIETALQWSALAGERLPIVVEYEIHKRSKPQSYTVGSLKQLLDVADKVAIQRLAGLEPPVRSALFEAAGAELKGLGRSLTEPELTTLARYLTGLDKGASSRVLRAVAATPSKMQLLARTGVRDGILASQDQSAAVGMMLAADSVVPDPWTLAQHAQLAWDGKVAPRLMWEKHPVSVVGLGVFALILLSMTKRLIFGRRQKVIIKHMPAAAAASAPPIKSGRGRGTA
jgi:hypothetical protein